MGRPTFLMAIIFQSTCCQGLGSSREGEAISRFSKIFFELIHFAQDFAQLIPRVSKNVCNLRTKENILCLSQIMKESIV